MLIFPDFALKCIENLEKNGYEAYFVGGCVRDGLLGLTCDDIDITTSATPDEICNIFENTIPTGIKHGTITVIIDGKHIEVTTFRTESGYNDYRHPDLVEYVNDIKFDLSRRDFTVNAMAFNPSFGLIDLFGGIKDLESKIIRTVGEAQRRFDEDALRIIRAFRFAAKLGFSIEAETKKSALEMSGALKNISGERVYTELAKIANSPFPEQSIDLINTGALAPFGLGNATFSSASFRALSSLNLSTQQKAVLFVSLCEHDIDRLKNRLHPDNSFFDLIKRIDFLIESGPKADKITLKNCLRDNGDTAIMVYTARLEIIGLGTASKYKCLISEIKANNEPYLISHLAVDGKDLLSLGYRGEEVGTTLNMLLNEVISHPENNTKSFLLHLVQK